MKTIYHGVKQYLEKNNFHLPNKVMDNLLYRLYLQLFNKSNKSKKKKKHSSFQNL